PHQIGIVRWSIDHQELMALLHRGNGPVEFRKFAGLVLVDPDPFCAPDHEMIRYLESQLSTPSPGTAVFDVVGKSSLPTVEVDRSNSLTRFHQRDSKVQCNRGLTRAPFLVSHLDHMRRTPTVACSMAPSSVEVLEVGLPVRPAVKAE